VAGYILGAESKDAILLHLDKSSSSQVLAGSAMPVVAADLVTTSLTGSDELSQAIVTGTEGTVYAAGSSGSSDDTSLMIASYDSASESAAGASASAQSDGGGSPYFSITTVPVSFVTRVGALTGGQIKALNIDNEDCVSECQAECSGTEDEIATCEADCVSACVVPTIEKRGVVYSIQPHPEYEESSTDSTTSDSGSSTDTSTDTSDTSTSSTTSSDQQVLNAFATGKLFIFEEYLVKKGQTEDGSGEGLFSSQIDGLNPQTEYYVRAYAVLSDGTVIYGNEYLFKTSDSCFIATAAFGSIDAQGVKILRLFRDRYLKPHHWGRAFVALYYKVSPPIADFISTSIFLRVATLILLLPAVVLAAILLYVPMSVNISLIGLGICHYLTRKLKQEVV